MLFERRAHPHHLAFEVRYGGVAAVEFDHLTRGDQCAFLDLCLETVDGDRVLGA